MSSTLPTIERGTTYPISGTYEDKNGNTDITGATLFFTIKEDEYDANPTDADAIVKKTISSFDNPTLGEYSFTIDPADTLLKEPGEYYWDMKIKLASGAIYPLGEGKVKLSGNPTNRQS